MVALGVGRNVEVEVLAQEVQHGVHALVNGRARGIEEQFWCRRRLVRGTDAGELRDLTGAGAGVHAFDIAGLADFKRAAAIDLDEVLAQQTPHTVAIRPHG